MRKQFILSVAFLTVLGCATPEILEGEFFADRYLLILKSTKDYNEAVVFSEEASKKLKVKYDNTYELYSEDKGIYFSNDLPDDDYAGGYYPRRYGDGYISLENSSGYKGFVPGYILVVGDILPDEESSKKALTKVQKFYKDAYVKKTIMWMGCIH